MAFPDLEANDNHCTASMFVTGANGMIGIGKGWSRNETRVHEYKYSRRFRDNNTRLAGHDPSRKHFTR